MHQRGERAAAAAIYRAILAAEPDHAGALHHLGVITHEQGDTAEALRLITAALATNPDDGAALVNRGVVLIHLGRPEEALAAFDHALTLQLSAPALFGRGNALLALERREEAIAAYDAALTRDPDHAEALFNRGKALLELERPFEALPALRRAIALKPDYAEAHLTEALCRLLGGDFARGWRAYEWRWRTAFQTPSKRDFAQPLWLGEGPVAGETLLVHAEQGFGDTLQFCRYATLLAERGARVVLEVQPELKTLLASLGGVSTLIGRGEPLPDFDRHAPLLSLPLAFGTTVETIPASTPYLRAPPERVERWRARLPAGRRIGLAWSGRASHLNDHHRSLDPVWLTPLLATNATFVSLQKDYRPQDRAWLAAHPEVLDCSADLKDFADTAALARAMDLVITVDTSTAHLAGALGIPAWILLPFIALDWRWLLGRDDTPWYPQARLFRQRGPGQWPEVITRIAQTLRSL